MRISDWSSDVCSSDLVRGPHGSSLAGADVTYQFPDGSRVSAVSDGSGVATLPGLPDGHQRIYAAKAGYLPGAVRSEEHTSELQSLMRISYAVFCLKKKNTHPYTTPHTIQDTQHIHKHTQ